MLSFIVPSSQHTSSIIVSPHFPSYCYPIIYHITILSYPLSIINHSSYHNTTKLWCHTLTSSSITPLCITYLTIIASSCHTIMLSYHHTIVPSYHYLLSVVPLFSMPWCQYPISLSIIIIPSYHHYPILSSIIPCSSIFHRF